MSSSLAGLFILAVLFTGALVMWRANMVGEQLNGSAQKASANLPGLQVRTIPTITSATGDRNNNTLNLTVRNNGNSSVGLSTFAVTTSTGLRERTNTMYLLGLAAQKHFEAYIKNANFRIYLVGQTNGSAIYYNNDAPVLDPTVGSWQTFTATLAFPGYTVINPTDYLEVDLFAEATVNLSAEDVSVDFRIDDPGLAIADQMKVVEYAL